eukprot:jgi/Galph1/3135/GphlegSOOS_G1785.1
MPQKASLKQPKLIVTLNDKEIEHLLENLSVYKQMDVIRVTETGAWSDCSHSIDFEYYVCRLPLDNFVQLDVLKAFGFHKDGKQSLLKGMLLLRGAVDRTNTFCITSNGVMHMIFDKDTYESFGLIGKKIYCGNKSEYYHIEVNLHAVMSPKKRRYRERLQWCLQRLKNPVEVVISCDIPLEHIPFRGLENLRKLTCAPRLKSYSSLRTPLVDRWCCPWEEYMQKKTVNESTIIDKEDWSQNVECFIQWIGALITECPAILEKDHELLNEYVCPNLEEFFPHNTLLNGSDTIWTLDNVQHQQWQGMIGCHHIKTCLNSLQQEVQSGSVQWGVISLLVFEDMPLVHRQGGRIQIPSIPQAMGLMLVLLPMGKRLLFYPSILG